MDNQTEFKQRIKNIILTLPIVIPVVFVLVFFGYFRVRYDIILHVDNIKGEGICQTFGSKLDGMTSVDLAAFYFGKELKEATIKGAHYDVKQLSLVTSDVSEFDIVSVDSYVKGIHTGHFEAADLVAEGETLEGKHSKLTSKNGVLHIDVFNPDEGAIVIIEQPFVPLWFWILYYSGIFIISLLCSILFSYLFDKIPALKLPAVNPVCIIVTMLAGCFFCGCMSYITYECFLLNCVILFAAALLLNALSLPFLGTIAVMAFTTFWYIANYFVITLRGKPIMPADLKAIGTAKEVMGGYTFTPSWRMIVGVMAVIAYAVLLVFVWISSKPEKKQPLKIQLLKRGILIAVAVLLVAGAVNTKTFKSLNSFAWDTYLMRSFRQEGIVLAYLQGALNSTVKRPEGYSREKVNSYLEEYISTPTVDNDNVKPLNIIMVMNEAFSDLRTVGLDESIDVMPYVDSLKKNTVKGDLYVSIFGGGTCNTEFEALTGNTLAFLGVGAYPYTENVTDPLFSLASYFRKAGYSTEAFHPNNADNWNRNMVYPNLGFEKFNSIQDFIDFGEVERLHDEPADISDYTFMESVSDQYKNRGRFLFDVTMQNHSPYRVWLDVEKADSVTQNGSDLYVDTQVYLSLIKASDNEVKQLVETYKDSDEPTMIIFFGDHQPGLPIDAIHEIYTDIHSNLDVYKTRYFIWTNYETKAEQDINISANYLSWMILERGGFKLPPYIQMLKEIHEKYPVISAQGVMDSDGNVYTGVAELADDPLIQKYRYVQYANMFDEIDDAWFEVD